MSEADASSQDFQALGIVHNENEDEFMMRSSYVIYESIGIAERKSREKIFRSTNIGLKTRVACASGGRGEKP